MYCYQIRFCAFCPNVCRFNYPTAGVSQKESLALSALAYVAHAVVSKFIIYTKEVEKTIGRSGRSTEPQRSLSVQLRYPISVGSVAGRIQSGIVSSCLRFLGLASQGPGNYPIVFNHKNSPLVHIAPRLFLTSLKRTRTSVPFTPLISI